nr:hypothetical protein [Tanacetum cinerariifolium]
MLSRMKAKAKTAVTAIIEMAEIEMVKIEMVEMEMVEIEIQMKMIGVLGLLLERVSIGLKPDQTGQDRTEPRPNWSKTPDRGPYKNGMVRSGLVFSPVLQGIMFGFFGKTDWTGPDRTVPTGPKTKLVQNAGPRTGPKYVRKALEKASKSQAVIDAIEEPIARGPWYNTSLVVTHKRHSATTNNHAHINHHDITLPSRFQELTMMCTKMVPEEEDRVEKFIVGLPDNIQGNVIAAEPTRLKMLFVKDIKENDKIEPKIEQNQEQTESVEKSKVKPDKFKA